MVLEAVHTQLTTSVTAKIRQFFEKMIAQPNTTAEWCGAITSATLTCTRSPSHGRNSAEMQSTPNQIPNKPNFNVCAAAHTQTTRSKY